MQIKVNIIFFTIVISNKICFHSQILIFARLVLITKKRKIKLVLKIYTPENKPEADLKENIAQFLFKSLEQYGDPKSDILKCMNYALQETKSFGGFITVAFLDAEIVGAVIINQTGMKDYIPENILVYIATDATKRGQGIGRKLMEKAIETAEGNIALHVEADNPAKMLYEKLGFTNKYLEMRLVKS